MDESMDDNKDEAFLPDEYASEEMKVTSEAVASILDVFPHANMESVLMAVTSAVSLIGYESRDVLKKQAFSIFLESESCFKGSGQSKSNLDYKDKTGLGKDEQTTAHTGIDMTTSEGLLPDRIKQSSPTFLSDTTKDMNQSKNMEIEEEPVSLIEDSGEMENNSGDASTESPYFQQNLDNQEDNQNSKLLKLKSCDKYPAKNRKLKASDPTAGPSDCLNKTDQQQEGKHVGADISMRIKEFEENRLTVEGCSKDSMNDLKYGASKDISENITENPTAHTLTISTESEPPKSDSLERLNMKADPVPAQPSRSENAACKTIANSQAEKEMATDIVLTEASLINSALNPSTTSFAPSSAPSTDSNLSNSDMSGLKGKLTTVQNSKNVDEHQYRALIQKEKKQEIPEQILDDILHNFRDNSSTSAQYRDSSASKPGASSSNEGDRKLKKKPECNKSLRGFCQNLLTKRLSQCDLSSGSTVKKPKLSEEPAVSEEDEPGPSTHRRKNSVPSVVTCESCDASCNLESVTQCIGAHILCYSCIEEEIQQFMESETKIDLNCTVHSCDKKIELALLEQLLPSLVINLLKGNLRRKEQKMSASTISKLSGLVRCPSCPFSCVLDENETIFKCGNKDCRVKCCRYCNVPLRASIGHHNFCESLKFVGPECLQDINVLPANWERRLPQPMEPYKSVPVQLEVPEGMALLRIFAATSLAKDGLVSNIWRIQNKRLWEKFVLKRKHIEEEVGRVNLNERHLFHGTSFDNLHLICKEGFDMRVPTVHGAVYGKGIYFSTTPTLSSRYVTNSDMMFVTRVVCGLMAQGGKQMTRPPHSPEGRIYDSCVNNLNHPSIHVLFDNAQCYPEYLIQIKK